MHYSRAFPIHASRPCWSSCPAYQTATSTSKQICSRTQVTFPFLFQPPRFIPTYDPATVLPVYITSLHRPKTQPRPSSPRVQKQLSLLPEATPAIDHSAARPPSPPQNTHHKHRLSIANIPQPPPPDSFRSSRSRSFLLHSHKSNFRLHYPDFRLAEVWI
jgi:hypothetical protein